MDSQDILPSSFRDPSGFVFNKDGKIYRQVNSAYRQHYDRLMSSGLYEELVNKNLLIPHREQEAALQAPAYKIIEPVMIPYISYPYEWSFSQLKDAALCTMRVQITALRYGMILKDASAYNIQFFEGAPVFIDTLSFIPYQEGEAWVAYRQFCQHFLGPLALMAHTDVRLSQLLRVYIDGIPLDLVSNLLPFSTYLNFSLLSHLHLHAKSQSRFADSAVASGKKSSPRKITALGFRALMESIQGAVNKLVWKKAQTEWGNYYAATNYQQAAMAHKEALVAEFLDMLQTKPEMIHDLGANDGRFSRIAAHAGFWVVSQDIDPVAVESNYLHAKQEGETKLLPLLLDLTNPSPDLGWGLQERESFLGRSRNVLVMALALIHHLAISNNVPLEDIARFFSGIAKHLIIEFVPKQDTQVKRLLATREDIFPQYHLQGFEEAFAKYFKILNKVPIKDCERTLYLLERV